MPFNGAGVYSPPGADFPAVTQTVISSTHYNNVINDLATGLSLCLTKDGQQVAAANIPFGGFRATNVGITAIAGSVGTPAINLSDATTGLYRSAVSEIAISISGTQVARFDSTGLVMTGGVSGGALSGTQLTLTAAASRIIPGATSLSLRNNANSADNLLISDAGAVTVRTSLTATTSVVTPIVDSGSTGSLLLKTNNGTVGLQILDKASGVNFLAINSQTAGGFPAINCFGSAANIGLDFITKGSGANAQIRFNTGGDGATIGGGGAAVVQFAILDTAAATRYITITGSNGGNPTIGVTAGSLAITPAVVMASTLVVSGSTLQVGTNPAASAGINISYASFLNSRNSANSADLNLIGVSTVNAIADVGFVGASGAVGFMIKARSGGAPPTTLDLPAGVFTVWRDTGGATTKVYYNNAGAIQSVALA